MNIKSIHEIAKQRGVVPGKLIKTELVRKLQHEEGTTIVSPGLMTAIAISPVACGGKTVSRSRHGTVKITKHQSDEQVFVHAHSIRRI